MLALRKYDFEKFILIVAFFSFCNNLAIADSGMREIDAIPTDEAELKLKKKIDGVEWIVFEKSDCSFYVFYKSKKIYYKNGFGMSDCSAMTNTAYNVLDSSSLIANWASERGGYAYVLQASKNRLTWIELEYKSSDESYFFANKNRSAISVQTDKSKITVEISKSGELKLRPDFY